MRKLEDYEDPEHEANSSKYWTGKTCVEIDCNHPAGTAWSPHWCFKHNAARMKRIDDVFALIGARKEAV